MNRSGYSEDYDDELQLGRWRGVIASTLRGQRGQRFLRELVLALDRLPRARLVKNVLETEEGEVCALGAVLRGRGMGPIGIDTEDWDQLGKELDIAPQLAQEVMYLNDEPSAVAITPEERWKYIRKWAVSNIKVREDEIIDG